MSFFHSKQSIRVKRQVVLFLNEELQASLCSNGTYSYNKLNFEGIFVINEELAKIPSFESFNYGTNDMNYIWRPLFIFYVFFLHQKQCRSLLVVFIVALGLKIIFSGRKEFLKVWKMPQVL